MTHESATPTFCIHVQHSWIYSVTQAACGTLSFDDCIISWHYLIQSLYMHNEAWTKKLPNLLSFFIGVCAWFWAFFLSPSCFLCCFLPFSFFSRCIARIFMYSQLLTHHPFSCPLLSLNPLFSTLLSPFLISLSCFYDVSTVFVHLFSTSPPQFYPLVLSSISCQWKC